jgi:hypothetical protein
LTVVCEHCHSRTWGREGNRHHVSTERKKREKGKEKKGKQQNQEKSQKQRTNSKTKATTYSEIRNRCQNVVGSESDVLNTSTAMVLDVFLNLRLLQPFGRFIDGHLDHSIVIGDNDRTKSTREEKRQKGSERKYEQKRRKAKEKHARISKERNLYWVWTCLSSTDQKRWKSRVFSYHLAIGSICKSG